MKLNQKQKEDVIRCVGEGLRTDEINSRGKLFKPPYEVTRSQVQYYRDKFNVDLATMTAESDSLALSQGIALRAVRVKKLALLAAILEEDLITEGKIWLERERCIGGGQFGKYVVELEFNEAEIRQLRGIYDDVAHEVGDRRNTVDFDPDDKGLPAVVVYVPDNGRN